MKRNRTKIKKEYWVHKFVGDQLACKTVPTQGFDIRGFWLIIGQFVAHLIYRDIITIDAGF